MTHILLPYYCCSFYCLLLLLLCLLGTTLSTTAREFNPSAPAFSPSSAASVKEFVPRSNTGLSAKVASFTPSTAINTSSSHVPAASSNTISSSPPSSFPSVQLRNTVREFVPQSTQQSIVGGITDETNQDYNNIDYSQADAGYDEQGLQGEYDEQQYGDVVGYDDQYGLDTSQSVIGSQQRPQRIMQSAPKPAFPVNRSPEVGAPEK